MELRRGPLAAFKQGCTFPTELLYLVAALFACLPIPAVAGNGAGLELHLEFENNVFDSSTNGFDGQAFGNLQYAPGVIGQAASFDGTDDQVLFPSFPDALLGQNDFTIAFWFSIPVDQGYSVLGKRQICARDPFLDIRTGGTNPNVSLEVSSPAQNYFPGSVPNPSGWQHVVFTRSGAAYQTFFNGQLLSVGTTTVTLDLSNTATLGLSNSPCINADGTNMLKGQIDDLRIYSRVLSAPEVASLVGLVFADNLESGDTAAWSQTVP
jgi:hypothetical protein